MSKPPASLATLASMMPAKGTAAQPEQMPLATPRPAPATVPSTVELPEMPSGARRPSAMNLKLTPELSEALALRSFETGRTKQELVTEALNRAFKLK